MAEKKLEKQRPKRPKRFVKPDVSQMLQRDVIKVDSELSKLSTKRSRQTILSFKVIKR
jgi:hypothetical protein